MCSRRLFLENVGPPPSGCSLKEFESILSVHLDLGALSAIPVLIEKSNGVTQEGRVVGNWLWEDSIKERRNRLRGKGSAALV